MTRSKFKIYSMKITEKQFELGPRCCALVSAPGARLRGVLELGDSFLGARSPFLPAELVYSIVLGLVLGVGLVQVLAQLLLGTRTDSRSRTCGELALDNINN